MKAFPEQILLNKNNEIIQKKIFLISGNEQTLISRIEREIINRLKLHNFKNIKKIEGGAINSDIEHLYYDNLFNELTILIFYNPKDINIDYLETINTSNLAIIICHNNLKNSSKIKIDFEKNQKFVSFNCYKLSRENKKLYFDNYISKNKLILTKDAYWFFLENASDLYQIFENDMIKIYDINNKKIELNDIRLILSKNVNLELEKIFFLLPKSPKEIVLKTSNSFKNSSESLAALHQIKYFINLLVISNNTTDIEKNFPKYLFKEKPTFKKIFNNINTKKILKIFVLIKKTEILLKKYTAFSNPISQRFLINLSKHIK